MDVVAFKNWLSGHWPATCTSVDLAKYATLAPRGPMANVAITMGMTCKLALDVVAVYKINKVSTVLAATICSSCDILNFKKKWLPTGKTTNLGCKLSTLLM